MTLGWRLRMSLEHAGIKADEMAQQLHVHRGTVTRWTHDIGSPPRAIYLERWAQITRVPLAWLQGADEFANKQGTSRDSLRNRPVVLAA